MKVRAFLPLAGALAAVAAGAALVLLAEDVRRWPDRFRAGDVRYRGAPLGANPWRRPDGLRLGVTERLLAVRDDLAFREAVRTFRLSRPRSDELPRGSEAERARATAEAVLAAVEADDRSRLRRSRVAVLLAILAYETSTAGGAAAGEALDRSEDELRRAVLLDPRNEEAKFNLELLLYLRSARPGAPAGAMGGAGGPTGEAGGAGLGEPGRGY